MSEASSELQSIKRQQDSYRETSGITRPHIPWFDGANGHANSQLFRLPMEIRVLIYSYVFGDHWTSTIHIDVTKSKDVSRWPPTRVDHDEKVLKIPQDGAGLTCVSSAVRREVLSEYIRRAALIITDDTVCQVFIRYLALWDLVRSVRRLHLGIGLCMNSYDTAHRVELIRQCTSLRSLELDIRPAVSTCDCALRGMSFDPFDEKASLVWAITYSNMESLHIKIRACQCRHVTSGYTTGLVPAPLQAQTISRQVVRKSDGDGMCKMFDVLAGPFHRAAVKHNLRLEIECLGLSFMHPVGT